MKKSIIALSVSLLMANSTMAMPTNGKILSGSSSVSNFSANPKSSSTINVNGNAEIFWDDFTLKAGEIIHFNVKNGCTLKIRSGKAMVIDGALKQNGGGTLDLWNNNVKSSANSFISADTLNFSGAYITVAGKINVNNRAVFFSDKGITVNNADVLAKEIAYVTRGTLDVTNSKSKSTGSEIILCSERTSKNNHVTADSANKIKINNCKFESAGQVYLHSYSADINNSSMLSNTFIQLYAMNIHDWDSKKNIVTNSGNDNNLLNLNGNNFSAKYFITINGGKVNVQGNKLMSGQVNLLAGGEFKNHKIINANEKNTLTITNNSITSAKKYVSGGIVTIDGQVYNKKAHYTHTIGNYNIDVDVMADSKLSPSSAPKSQAETTSVSKPKPASPQSVSAPAKTEKPVSNDKEKTPIRGEEVTLEADGYYTMGDNPNDNVALAKSYAKDAAMRSIAEQLGVYIESYSEVKNAKLTVDEIKAISANVLKIKDSKITTSSSGDAVVYKCHIVAVVNTKDVDLQSLLRNREQKNLEDKITELEHKYEEMMNKMN
ncbi:MAG: hypothetical protein SO022_08590 [Selenomonadaceae bacterium]|nr:hypothetical protein [Selenomonadaceae bacterium]